MPSNPISSHLDTKALISDARARTRILRRESGRAVAWLELGDPAGRPLLHFHGTGFCRFEALTGTSLATNAGVRLIAFDRPGFGASDPFSKSGLDAVAEDALALVDHLELEQFAVSGFSGGFPHALATAARAGLKCNRVMALNTAGDVADEAWQVLPRMARLILNIVTTRAIARVVWPRLFADLHRSTSADHPPERTAILREAFLHGSEQGHDAALDELALFYRQGWGDPWSGITAPIILFHGLKDSLLPFAQALAAKRTNVMLTKIAGDHLDWATPEVWQAMLSHLN